jgi:hypothetical protein
VVTTLRNWKLQDPSNTLKFLMEYDSTATAVNESSTLSGVWDFYQYDTPAGLAVCRTRFTATVSPVVIFDS